MQEELNNLLAAMDRLRKQRFRQLAGCYVGGGGCVFAAWLWLGVLLDFCCSTGLPPFWRWLFASVLAIGLLAGLAALAFALRRRLSDQAMAALLERARPGLRNTLINAVQFHERGNVSPEIIQGILRESPLAPDDVRASELYPRSLRLRILRGAGLLLILWLCLAGYSLPGAGRSVIRILLPFVELEQHTRTRITQLEPGDTALRRGQELSICLTISGQLPESAVLLLEQQGMSAQRFDLDVELENVFSFSGKSTPVFENARYRVQAGDAVSRWYDLKMLSPPVLKTWDVKVIPPAGTGRPGFTIQSGDKDLAVPADSLLFLRAEVSRNLQAASIIQGNKVLAEKLLLNGTQLSGQFQVGEQGSVALKLESDVDALVPLPWLIMPDRSPRVTLQDTALKMTLQKGDPLPVGFLAEDDYAIARVGLEQILEQNTFEPLRTAVPEQEFSARFPGRFVVDTSSFRTSGNIPLKFRIWAEDKGRDPEKRRGYSPVIQVLFPEVEQTREKQAEIVQTVGQALGELIKLQRENLKETRTLSDLAMQKKTVSSNMLAPIEETQKKVREIALALLQQRETLGGLADVLLGLVNAEMPAALELFDRMHRNDDKTGLLQQEVQLQIRILAALTGIHDQLQTEQTQREKQDLFAFLQRLVKLQKQNLQEARNLNSGAAVELSALIHNQDEIAQNILSFSDQCLTQAENRTEDDYAIQVRKAHGILDKGRAYERALKASEFLEDKQLASAIPAQENVLKTLLEVLHLLNQWRMQNARKVLEEANAVLKNTHEELGELEKQQAKIAEVTRDLKKRGSLDDEAREQLARMDKEQEDMADLLEKLANDLYQFPELPVCNELNSRMREIYESVLQAMDSENMPSIEIAVQKEDAILDAIRSTKERIEDVEMWLMDIPDNIVWNMESFDTDEFPEIPLVPLPDELEDLVGDLLDQASDIDAQSQDTTGNNIVADAEMGWGVMDGPMPSFSAKGKSGNTRPNDNEMTGRSGAGREGQSTGELVENHVKGYEGRQTKARRTLDQFQKGMVTEDENSTLDARATGGGKLGGESETQGMFGTAPRRDLHTPSHGMTPQRLRQETEALYATARLLYLGTGSLGEAARELRGIENAAPQMKELGNLHRRVLRRLSDTQVEMKDGVVLPMPVATLKKTGGSNVDPSDWGQVADEYKDLLSDYFRSLDE